MRSVMKHSFSQVPSANIPRASFDRSSGQKLTINGTNLYPFFVDEVIPGDTFNLRSTFFGRMSTPIYPIMDNIFLDTFFFFVPNRLVWDNWVKLLGEQDNPGDSIDYLTPIRNTQPTEGSLYDYFGLPLLPALTTIPHNTLPMRCYRLIWNEWFRDQNLQNSVTVLKTDGPDDAETYDLLPRGKRHDYFTSCLPWPQKGDSVSVPIGTRADIRTAAPDGTAVGIMAPTGTQTYALDTDGTVDAHVRMDINSPGAEAMYADLTTATATTINQLRQSFQVQKLLERDARGGTRHTEIIRSHFGVVSPDARLQRPEYLGGGSEMINVNPVASTVENELEAGVRPQGSLAAYATVSGTHGFTKSFTEHGYIIGLMNVRADLTYQQGLQRMWSRRSRYDYYWPALSQIGEQAVLNKEIYAQGDPTFDDAVFGYQERSAEYRYKPSLITGAFRSAAAASLDPWHLSQDFGNLPVLGETFIQDNPPFGRVVATPEEPIFIVDVYHKLRCARPMPVHGVPGMIDHF